MELVTDENASKLSKIEQRKLKLAEYLAAKGRLKAPNPKPYLKEKSETRKPADNIQKVKIVGNEKENCGTNAKEGKREILKEVNKNASSKKVLGIHSQPKALAQASSNSRKTCQAGFHTLKTLQSPRKPHKAEKNAPTVPAAKGTYPQSLQIAQHKARQAQTASNCENKKLTDASIKSTSKIQTNRISKTQEKLAQQTKSAAGKFGIHTRSSHIDKPASLKSNIATNTSDVNQRKGVWCNATGTKAHTSITKRATISVSKTQVNATQQPKSQSAVPKLGKHNSSSQSTKVMTWKSSLAPNKSDTNRGNYVSCIITKAKSRPSVSSTLANNEGSAIIKNQQEKQTNVKLLSRKTRSCVLPQTNTAPRELQQQPTNRSKPTVQPKTPKSSVCPSTQGVRTAPVDGNKKPTAAQEERLRKLHEWRESRGITYKRPPMPVRLVRRKTVSVIPQPYWSNMENEDEGHDIVFAVDRSLDDCVKLLQQGFPVDQVRDVLSRVPMAQKFAKYWICQARLMEREGNLEVLSLFQEAVRIVREPVDELRSVIFEILKKRQIQGLSPLPKAPERVETTEDDEQKVCDVICTPKPVGALICGMRGDSSVVKYKITATPGGKRSQQGAEPGQADGHEIRFFTPVRRSVRIEKTVRRYPTALQEHDPCVTSLSDLAGESEEVKDDQSSPLYVYRENEALRDHVHVKLVYPEEAET